MIHCSSVAEPRARILIQTSKSEALMSHPTETNKPRKLEWSTPQLTRLANLAHAEAHKTYQSADEKTVPDAGVNLHLGPHS